MDRLELQQHAHDQEQYSIARLWSGSLKPAGNLHGMPVFIDRNMPAAEIRFVQDGKATGTIKL